MSAGKTKKPRKRKPFRELRRRRTRVVPVISARKAQRWCDAAADDTAARLHWLHVQNRDEYLPRYFAGQKRAYPYPTGFQRAWRWYAADVLIGATRVWRVNSRFVKESVGISRMSQFWQLLSMSTRLPTMPENYYKFELYRRKNRARAGDYLHRYETKGALYRMMTDEPALDVRAPLTDKPAFTRMADAAGLVAAGTVATAREGRFELVVSQLPKADLFVKPEAGRGGAGAQVWVYLEEEDSYRRIGGKKLVAAADFGEYLAKRSVKGSLLVQPRLAPHPDIADIAMDALPTCRIITITDEAGNGEPVIAVFRMAAKAGSIVDNIHAGGIACPVDLETGVLGTATDLGLKPTTRHTVHPATGGVIEGRSLPMWEEILDVARRAHDVFTPRKIIGWDISIGPEGPVIVEGNSQPCVDLLQRPHDMPLGTHRFGELLSYHVERTCGEKAVGR